MAGYGLRAFLIAQSLNQIEKAYGPNNSILDNCHVRVAFASNDERTAKRISDALGTATELRAHAQLRGPSSCRPWLGHLMVSRQESARQLLTPGEVMQLPPDDEIVMVSGHPPVRAKKLRFYADANFKPRVLSPPTLSADGYADKPPARSDDWSGAFDRAAADAAGRAATLMSEDDGGLRRQPELEIAAPQAEPEEDEPRPDLIRLDDDADDAMEDARASRAGQRQFARVARNAALDPDDGIGL